MGRWAVLRGVDRCATLAVVLEVLALLGTLPALEPLLPLPGACRHTTVAAADVDEKASAGCAPCWPRPRPRSFPRKRKRFRPRRKS
jgi:hypothetical protein